MKSLHDVDLKYLKIFSAVVENGGFTAAEGVLNISCSSISKAIAELEGRLAVSLCRRGRGGFELTEQGEKLYQASGKLFAAVDQYVDEVAHLDGAVDSVLRVAVVDNTTPDPNCPLVAGLQQLQQERPGLLIDLQIMASNEMTLALLKNELDIGVTLVHHKVKGLCEVELYKERVAPYVAVEHEALWEKGVVDMADLGDLRLTTYTHREPGALMTSKQSRHFYFCPQIEGVLILTLSGNHVGLLPRFYALSWVENGRLKELQVPELCIDSPVVALSKTNGSNQELVDRLVVLMQEACGAK